MLATVFAAWALLAAAAGNGYHAAAFLLAALLALPVRVRRRP